MRTGIDQLPTFGTNIKTVYDKRHVDNGKIITTAGLSSGIDGAFYLVSKMMGKGIAQETAANLEYKWDANGKFVRAAYADRYLPYFQRMKTMDGTTISLDGDTERWEWRILVTRPGSVKEIMDLIQNEIVSNTPHKSSAVTIAPRGVQNASRSEIEWKFADDEGRAWKGSGVGEATPDGKGVNLTIRLARAR